MRPGDAKLVEAYRKHRTLRAAAAECGCSYEWVRQALIRSGVATRRRSPEPKLWQEVLEDLPSFPQGASLADLTEYYGESPARLGHAVAWLFRAGKIAVTTPQPKAKRNAE